MPCAAPVTMAILSASRMRRRYHLAEKTVNDRALSGVLLALRAALELVLQGLEGDGPEAAQARRDQRDRPIDLNLAGVIHRVCQRGRSVRVGGVDGRIERLERIERAVGRHRSALLGCWTESSAARARCEVGLGSKRSAS